MNFFIPAAKDEEESEGVYKSIKDFARQTLGWNVTERRIFSLTYQHEGERYYVEVGKPDPRVREIVVAILESNAYLVCTYNRGVVRGEPFWSELTKWLTLLIFKVPEHS